MGRKKSISGLRKRKGIWHIEKTVSGVRLFESTGTGNRKQAEEYLMYRLEKIRVEQKYGARPSRSFAEAAAKYLAENQHKRTINEDVLHLRYISPYIDHLDICKVNMSYLQPYIQARQRAGVKNRTINYALEIVRRILKLASEEWVDASNVTWLENAPKIKLLPRSDERKPYPLSWEEQDRLFALLPLYLRRMALFKVNTGLRDQEVCRLQWNWEYTIPELRTSVFVVPSAYMKNGQDRLVVLNDMALQVIEEVRGQHPLYVFTGLDGKNRLYDMDTRSWRNAKAALGLPVRIHDLKHTYGRRLRAANVSLEDRQDLLGHKSGRITTHYSAAEVQNLIDAANKVCQRQISTPTLTFIRTLCGKEQPDFNLQGLTFRQNSGTDKGNASEVLVSV